MRQRSLGELTRVSESCPVIGGPFDDAHVAQAEEIMEALILTPCGEVHHCLREHRTCGLPNSDVPYNLVEDEFVRIRSVLGDSVVPTGGLRELGIIVNGVCFL